MLGKASIFGWFHPSIIRFGTTFGCCPHPSVTIAMWQTPVLCVTLNGQFFQMLGSYTRAIVRFFDVVREVMSVTKSTGFAA